MEVGEVNKNDGPIIATLAFVLDVALIYSALTGTGQGYAGLIAIVVGVPTAIVLLVVAAFLWGRSR